MPPISGRVGSPWLTRFEPCAYGRLPRLSDSLTSSRITSSAIGSIGLPRGRRPRSPPPSLVVLHPELGRLQRLVAARQRRGLLLKLGVICGGPSRRHPCSCPPSRAGVEFNARANAIRGRLGQIPSAREQLQAQRAAALMRFEVSRRARRALPLLRRPEDRKRALATATTSTCLSENRPS